jgi:peptide/nickel transport system permease protein
MTAYLIRRLLWSVVVIFGLAAIVFFVMHMVGDPARLMLPQEATEEQYQALRKQLGLDAPLPVRFATFMLGMARLDFGDSLWQNVPALPLVMERVPNTIYLAAATLVLAIPIALVLGVLAALWPGSAVDRTITFFSLAGVSVASFWLALTLILVFAAQLKWLPSSGIGGLSYVILPALTLGLRPIGRIGQVTRATMLDELSKQYIQTARAKGLRDRTIFRVHALKNAALPIITMTGDEMAGLLNGAVVIETVFAWPGIGGLMIQAIERRDFPLVEAALFVIAITVVVLNLLVDLSYSLLDPRVRYS